jgi:hypothetical protein
MVNKGENILKLIRFLSLSILLLLLLVAGCSSTSTHVDPKPIQDTKLQKIVADSLDAVDNSSKNQIFA